MYYLNLSERSKILFIDAIDGHRITQIYIDQVLFELIAFILSLDYENGELLLYEDIYSFALKYVKINEKWKEKERNKYLISRYMDLVRKKIKVKGIPLIFLNERGKGYKILIE